jgi:HTH-type transcriptional regulator, transcriptional repressor of NAD biosynthesis genes
VKLYNTGFVVGKFLPCHTGHHYLVDTAQAQCENLTVAVVDDPTFDTIDSRLRQDWMQLRHPRAKVIVIEQLQGKDDDSKAWAQYTKEIFDGKVPDVVFTSEEYGKTWAQELGCHHVQVDLNRTRFGVSGTAVRADPTAQWDYLCPSAKAYYAKRVCLIGGESVGKTTTAKQLAKHYDTTWCSEYGRYYCETHAIFEDDGNVFPEIYIHQPEWEDACAMACNKLLICDTDLVTTSVWYERWCGDRGGMWGTINHAGIDWAKQHYDLYLLLDHNVPWVNDGSRSEGDPATREWFSQNLFTQALKTDVPVIRINTADFDQRIQDCITIIDNLVFGCSIFSASE